MATERVILCGGVSDANLPFQDGDPVRLGSPNSAGSNVRLRIEDVRHGMTRDVPPQFLDLLDIATYVYVADQAVSAAVRRPSTSGRVGGDACISASPSAR